MPEHDDLDEHPRSRRFRVAMTRALPAIRVALPAALVVAGAAFLTMPDGGLPNFAAMIGVAVLAFAALSVLTTMRARQQSALLTKRDSIVVAVLLVCAVAWLFGVAALPAMPMSWAGVTGSAFIHGMFGVCVTVGLLIASAARRPRGDGDRASA